jgi:ATP-dependent DNA helicase RecQ
MIEPAQNRMIAEHPITINRARKKNSPGGQWQLIDPVAKGRVQVLPAGKTPIDQAVTVMTELTRLAGLAEDWHWNNCAVIAREWKFLEPVRAWCELHKIPVQTADEDALPLWRLREAQALIRWIRDQKLKLISPKVIYEWLDAQPSGPWWTLLRDTIDSYVLEVSEEELPVQHFFEWLAEWGRDLRRRQTGLMLLTAHRAKGLEFDHVAVLDGAWEKQSGNEDKDSPRRLYYVAMTRAKQTLLLARLGTLNLMLNTLPENPAILVKPVRELPAAENELHRRYLRLSLKDIDLGFAGRYANTHPVHRVLAELKPEDPLVLKQGKNAWELANRKGTVVCRLARAFSPPDGKQFVAAKALAVIVRLREDSEPEYQDHIQCDRWEIVIPELIFE